MLVNPHLTYYYPYPYAIPMHQCC